METAELNNLNRDGLFEMLKGKCKSRAKIYQYVVLMFIIIAIAAIQWPWLFGSKNQYHDKIDYILSLVFFILLVCEAGWLALYNYRFKKKIDSLETPEQLLHLFNKKIRCERISTLPAFFVLLLTIGYDGFAKSVIGTENIYVVVFFVVAAALCVIYLSLCNGFRISRKDREIIEQLDELVGEV